ncbi:alpha-amylase [Histomonas meleagridis]|uniref:alpha-amylase n=1 Tax=Histomonas meleagridis TaxID=135588 RepID=UPI00355A98BB|nr:alpha-amylase [Histomonas meleagridis]KAH0803288.1 alpha-amylase [Histomonas meleagridis]
MLKIEPPFWWAGMKDKECQLMIYGEGISKYTNIEISNPNIKILSIVTLTSPNYLIIYIDTSLSGPCKFTIKLSSNTEISFEIEYELKQRQHRDNPKGFSSSDVLYLIMVDRFSKGRSIDYGDLEIPKKEEEEESNANSDEANDESEEQITEQETSENIKEESTPFHDPNFPSIHSQYTVNRNDPDSRHGGDFQGIIDHLDYLSDLGVTALWLTPVFTNDMPGGSYHGYASTDFYHTDPRFGSINDFCSLISSAHQKGIKIVMDQVFNHCGSKHVWRIDTPSRDWFNFPDSKVQTTHEIPVLLSPYSSEIDKREFNDGFFVEAMPDLNQRNVHLKKYLIQNSIWWIENCCLDGIRQDTYPYCDQSMMCEWVSHIEDEYPWFNIVGECWVENTLGSACWQRGSNHFSPIRSNLRTVMDFSFTKLIHDATHNETDHDNGLWLLYRLLNYDFIYPDIKHVLRFLDNHDTNRFLIETPKDLFAYKIGVTLLLTLPGIPQLYYGTEILMSGVKNISDGYVRKDFPGGWKTDKINCFDENGRNDLQNEAFDFIRNLLKWRKGKKVIAKGEMKHFRVTNGIYVYERKYKKDKVIVICNGTSETKKMLLERYNEVLGDVEKATDVITKKVIELNEKELVLEPKQLLVLEI